MNTEISAINPISPMYRRPLVALRPRYRGPASLSLEYTGGVRQQGEDYSAMYSS